MERLSGVALIAGAMAVSAALLFFAGQITAWERRISAEFYRRNLKLVAMGRLSDRILSSSSQVLSRRIVGAAGLIFSAALLFLTLR